jgi:hypothetical protein
MRIRNEIHFHFRSKSRNLKANNVLYADTSQADLCTIIKLSNRLDPCTLQFRSDPCYVIH